VTPAEWILEAVAKVTHCKVRDLRGRERHRWIVMRRRFACQKLWEAGYGFSDIGRILGGRNHTTIMYYLGRA